MNTPPELSLWVSDYFGIRKVQIAEFQELKVERFLQGVESLSFILRNDDPKLRLVFEEALVQFEPDDGDRWYVDHIEDVDNLPCKMIVCFPTWIRLGTRMRPGKTFIQGKRVEEGISDIILNSGWEITGSYPDDDVYTMEIMDGSVLSLLRDWALLTRKEIIFHGDTLQVEFVNSVGENRGVAFYYGHNVEELKRTFRGPEATRLYAYGANDLSIGAANPFGVDYVEDYSWYEAQGLTTLQARALYRKDLIWVDTRYLTGVNLYDAAMERIADLSQPTITYEAQVVDVARLLSVDAQNMFFIGDFVKVRDEILGMDLPTRVVRIARYPIEPRLDQIELGFLNNGEADLQSESRSTNYSQLVPIVSSNDTALTISATPVAYGEILLTSAGEATIITGSTFIGTATGTGTITWGLYIDGAPIGATKNLAFTNGQEVEFSWPSFATGVDEGPHTVQWRAQITSGSGTVSLGINQGRSWVIASGAVGVGSGGNPSVYHSETLTTLYALEFTDEYEVVFVELVDHIVELDDDIPEEVTELEDVLVLPWTIGDSQFGIVGGPGRLSSSN